MPDYEYLYGLTKEQVKTLKEVPYEQALKQKIIYAKQVLTILVNQPYMQWDLLRVNKVSKAIKFNERLLKELE